MTPTPPPESIISFSCRLYLASELGIEPEDLEYLGDMQVIGAKLVMFNVMKEGHERRFSTLSVRVEG